MGTISGKLHESHFQTAIEESQEEVEAQISSCSDSFWLLQHSSFRKRENEEGTSQGDSSEDLDTLRCLYDSGDTRCFWRSVPGTYRWEYQKLGAAGKEAAAF